MLVPDKRPAAKPPVSNAPKNDASMWMQAPVSADDFVSAPRRKPVAPGGGSGRAVIVGLMAAAFVGVSAAGVYFAFLKDSPKNASFASPSTPGSAAPAPAVATATPDAAVAAATPDAAAAAAPDAGAPAMVAGMKVDAITAADPAVKKTKKRATTKKKPTKKKTATAPKRRK